MRDRDNLILLTREAIDIAPLLDELGYSRVLNANHNQFQEDLVNLDYSLIRSRLLMQINSIFEENSQKKIIPDTINE